MEYQILKFKSKYNQKLFLIRKKPEENGQGRNWFREELAGKK